MKTNITQGDLDGFIGTTTYYRHSLVRNLVYTDGVQYLAEAGEAYWLIDAVASYLAEMRDPQFLVWRLRVRADKSAVLVARKDTGQPARIVQKFEYTDFPLEEVTLWAEWNDAYGWVLYLPSEH